jgi:hypothetical protein
VTDETLATGDADKKLPFQTAELARSEMVEYTIFKGADNTYSRCSYRRFNKHFGPDVFLAPTPRCCLVCRPATHSKKNGYRIASKKICCAKRLSSCVNWTRRPKVYARFGLPVPTANANPIYALRGLNQVAKTVPDMSTEHFCSIRAL